MPNLSTAEMKIKELQDKIEQLTDEIEDRERSEDIKIAMDFDKMDELREEIKDHRERIELLKREAVTHGARGEFAVFQPDVEAKAEAEAEAKVAAEEESSEESSEEPPPPPEPIEFDGKLLAQTWRKWKPVRLKQKSEKAREAQSVGAGGLEAAVLAEDIMNKVRKSVALKNLKSAKSLLIQIEEQVELTVAAAREAAALSIDLGNPTVANLLEGAPLFFQPPPDEVAIAKTKAKKKRIREKQRRRELARRKRTAMYEAKKAMM